MRRSAKAFALAALTLTACGGYGYVGIGYYPCDPYYYDACYYYHYASWEPASIAVTDFDGDGLLDAVVSDDGDGTVWLAHGLAGGGFADPPSAPVELASPRATLAVLDADGNSHPDLVALGGSPGLLATFVGDGRGGFASLATTNLATLGAPGLVRFARGAIDGDTFDDVVTVDEAGVLRVALGTGTGAFTDAGHGDPAATFLGPDVTARLDGVHVALANFDDRLGVDLLVLDGDRARLALLSGHGDGTFDAPRIVPCGSLGGVLSVAPVSLDAGAASLAVLGGSHENIAAPSTLAVLRPGDGGFAVEPLPAGTARAIVALDLDGDGLSDLLLADALHREIRTLHARPAADAARDPR